MKSIKGNWNRKNFLKLALLAFVMALLLGCDSSEFSDIQTKRVVFYGIEYLEEPKSWNIKHDIAPGLEAETYVYYMTGDDLLMIGKVDIAMRQSFDDWISGEITTAENGGYDVKVRDVTVDGMRGVEFVSRISESKIGKEFKSISVYFERDEGEVYMAGLFAPEEDFAKNEQEYQKLIASIQRADQIEEPEDWEHIYCDDARILVSKWTERFQWKDGKQLLWTEVRREDLNGVLQLRVKSGYMKAKIQKIQKKRPCLW